jgi:hypothetical protein
VEQFTALQCSEGYAGPLCSACFRPGRHPWLNKQQQQQQQHGYTYAASQITGMRQNTSTSRPSAYGRSSGRCSKCPHIAAAWVSFLFARLLDLVFVGLLAVLWLLLGWLSQSAVQAAYGKLKQQRFAELKFRKTISLGKSDSKNNRSARNLQAARSFASSRSLSGRHMPAPEAAAAHGRPQQQQRAPPPADDEEDGWQDHAQLSETEEAPHGLFYQAAHADGNGDESSPSNSFLAADGDLADSGMTAAAGSAQTSAGDPDRHSAAAQATRAELADAADSATSLALSPMAASVVVTAGDDGNAEDAPLARAIDTRPEQYPPAVASTPTAGGAVAAGGNQDSCKVPSFNSRTVHRAVSFDIPELETDSAAAVSGGTAGEAGADVEAVSASLAATEQAYDCQQNHQLLWQLSRQLSTPFGKDQAILSGTSSAEFLEQIPIDLPTAPSPGAGAADGREADGKLCIPPRQSTAILHRHGSCRSSISHSRGHAGSAFYDLRDSLTLQFSAALALIDALQQEEEEQQQQQQRQQPQVSSVATAELRGTAVGAANQAAAAGLGIIHFAADAGVEGAPDMLMLGAGQVAMERAALLMLAIKSLACMAQVGSCWQQHTSTMHCRHLDCYTSVVSIAAQRTRCTSCLAYLHYVHSHITT